ncbi:MAG: flagellar basal body protein FliL [Thermotogae bacterium]|nr:MAG: flagellar basal body protein FliL [Thermotogota bacterium]
MPNEEGEKTERSGPGFLTMILVAAAVAAGLSFGVSFLLIKVMGTNTQPSQTQQAQQTQPAYIKALFIPEGSNEMFMLKGGKDVAVVDGLSFIVGSDECRAAIANAKSEIMDSLETLFLSKEKTELTTVAGRELLKKQIKDMINEITAFVGEREKFGVLKVALRLKAISRVE